MIARVCDEPPTVCVLAYPHGIGEPILACGRVAPFAELPDARPVAVELGGDVTELVEPWLQHAEQALPDVSRDADESVPDARSLIEGQVATLRALLAFYDRDESDRIVTLCLRALDRLPDIRGKDVYGAFTPIGIIHQLRQQLPHMSDLSQDEWNNQRSRKDKDDDDDK